MITVGVAGLGYWGPHVVRNFGASPRTQLAWLCDRDPERLGAVAQEYPGVRCTTRFDEMIADAHLDAVAIATPVTTHHGMAKAALMARKHVLVEKPLAASVDEAAELVELAQRHDRVLLVDHIFSRKSILYNDLDASERLKVYERGVDVSGDPSGIRDVLISYRSGDVVAPKLDPIEPLFRVVEHLADCIEGRRTPISDGAQGLRIVRVLEAAQRSLARGSERARL